MASILSTIVAIVVTMVMIVAIVNTMVNKTWSITHDLNPLAKHI